MMLLQLIIVPIFLILCSPLSREEDKELQEICGKTHIKSKNGRGAFRSMNTLPGTRIAAPFTVLLHHSFEDGSHEQRLNESEGICTGTIISRRHILTAAHCLSNYRCSEDGSYLLVNSYQEENGSEIEYRQKLNYIIISAPTNCQETCDTTLKNFIAKPKRAFINTNWIRNECGHNLTVRGDIAIIELEEDLRLSNTIQPACLYTGKVEVNTNLTIYGYGITDSEKMETFGIMRVHRSKLVSKEECLAQKSSLNATSSEEDEEDSLNILEINGTNNILKDEICSRDNHSMPCVGDSGSGVILRENKRAYVAAITSWGPECKPNEMKYPDDLIDVNTELFPHLDEICAITGICPQGYLPENREILLQREYHVMELDEDFEIEYLVSKQEDENILHVIKLLTA